MGYPVVRQIAFGSSSQGTTVNFVNAAFANTTLAGSTILSVSVCSNYDGHTIDHMHDPVNGNNWSLVLRTTDTGNQDQAMFAFVNANSLPAGTNVTSTPTGTEDYQGIMIIEFTNVANTIGNVIVTGNGVPVVTTGSTTNDISSGTKNMGSSPLMLLGFMQNDGGAVSPYVPSPGTGFTSLGTSWNWNLGSPNFLAEYQNLANPGTVAATATSSGADNFVAQSVGILGLSTIATFNSVLVNFGF